MTRAKNILIRCKDPFCVLLMLCFFWAWICFYWDVYLSPTELFPRDNTRYHFPTFLYFTHYLARLHHFPQWLYTGEGGVWVEALSNNFLLLLPHRLVGYFLAAILPFPTLFVYKISLLLGESLFLGGIYWLARLLAFSVPGSCLLVTGTFLSGATLTFVHQEHGLGTLFYVPFLWVSLLKLRDSGWGLFFFCALLGLSFDVHYPQLLFIYGLMVILAVVSAFSDFRPELLKMGKNIRAGGVRLWLACIIAFGVSASPVFFAYVNFLDKLESPFRHQVGNVYTNSYAEYELINSALTKADPRNFGLYFNFEQGHRWNVSLLDDHLFYASPCLTLMLLLLLFFKIRFKKFHLFMIFSLAVLALGTYTMIPKYLLWIVPGLRLFRQWYFLLAFLGLHLIFAVVVVFQQWIREGYERKRGLGLGATCAFLLLLWKWLPPLYVLPGAVACLIFGGYQWRFRQTLLSLILYGWFIGGSFLGARFMLGTYRENLTPIESSYLYSFSVEKPWLDPVNELRSIYSHIVALPIGLDAKTRETYRQSFPFYWDGKAIGNAQVISGGFRFQIPPGSRTFRWMQFNDGGWEIEIDGSVSKFTNKEAVLDIPKGAQTLTIKRKTSLWSWLIVFMWVPLLAGGIVSLLKRSMKSALKRPFYFAIGENALRSS